MLLEQVREGFVSKLFEAAVARAHGGLNSLTGFIIEVNALTDRATSWNTSPPLKFLLAASPSIRLVRPGALLPCEGSSEKPRVPGRHLGRLHQADRASVETWRQLRILNRRLEREGLFLFRLLTDLNTCPNDRISNEPFRNYRLR